MYQKFSDEARTTIGKFASEHGVASPSRKYGVAESSVRDWRNLYQRELTIKSKEVKVGEEVCIDALPSKKWGKPPLLDEKLDCHLQDKILAVRSRGTPIGTSILMKHKKATTSSFKLNKEWAKSVLHRMWGIQRERLIGNAKLILLILTRLSNSI